MHSILLVTASPRGEESLSSRVAFDLVETLRARDGDAVVIHRDIAADPLPHIDATATSAFRKPAEARTAAERAVIEVSDRLVSELLAADVVVIATGLINFSIASTLKSWIDHVARAGLTFRYTEEGPIGLATGKKVYLVLASGGIYSQGEAARMNHAVPYLRTVLGFMGMDDIEVIPVEGVAFGPEAAERALAEARNRARALALAA